ncbi:centromere protein W isoform X1 [Pogoniulus pusillus]|uniref:centromere protein W isoform X1 n=1 Tax=Pogoniulus pusillus TaxID=488313 RepID=UPI0030B92CA9
MHPTWDSVCWVIKFLRCWGKQGFYTGLLQKVDHCGTICGKLFSALQIRYDKVHLSFLLFLHRLAEEAKTNAILNKSKIIKPDHTIAAAKVILKKSRG